MILSAGRGERMRPLTDNCPKPLLKVKGIPLIEYHIKNLAAAGINDIVINHAWLGQKIVDYLGDGEKYGVNIEYSEELVALETAGGIIKALPILTKNNDVFVVVNGDIYTDYQYTELLKEVSAKTVLGEDKLSADFDAHLMLVKNPSHNVKGDFQLEDGKLLNPKDTLKQTYTFSGIGIYHKRFFEFSSQHDEKHSTSKQESITQRLAPMLRTSADKGRILASVLNVVWTDVGTPERLAQLNRN